MTNITPYGLIYKTTNLINGKIYIGQTVRIQKFLKNNYYGSGNLINYAIKKYGKNNFKTTLIQYCNTLEELNKMEEYYINLYNSIKPDGYNIVAGGASSGKRHQDTIDKMSTTAKLLWQNTEYREKNSKAITNAMSKKEVRRKLSEANKGRFTGEEHHFYGKHHTDESKAVMSSKLSGENNPFYGQKHSKETIAKLSELFSGSNNPNYGRHFKMTQEIKNKISKANKGKKSHFTGKNHNIDTKNNISQKMKNLPILECPHCGIKAKKNCATRYHFDNCKKLKHQSGGKINLEMILQNIKSSSLVEADKLYLKV